MINLVALRKESVDRNPHCFLGTAKCSKSLSARRAWIEIGYLGVEQDEMLSLSARRAWIEIRRGSEPWQIILSLSARRAWIEI